MNLKVNTMRTNRLPTLVTCCLLLNMAACAEKPAPDPLLGLTSDFVAAFNNGDAEAMVALVSDDVRWLTVDGDNITTEVAGRDALRTAMTGYFEGGTRSPSRMRHATSDGEYVIGVEEIMRGPTSEARNQCSVVVYRFKDSLIDDVWYYHPAYPC